MVTRHYYSGYTRRSIVFHDCDNVRINENNDGILNMDLIISKLGSIGYVDQYHAYLTNKEYTDEFNTIKSALGSRLGMYSYRFYTHLIENKEPNALDLELATDVFRFLPNLRNSNFTFIVISGDADFMMLRKFAEVNNVKLYFISPSNVRSKKLEKYNL